MADGRERAKKGARMAQRPQESHGELNSICALKILQNEQSLRYEGDDESVKKKVGKKTRMETKGQANLIWISNVNSRLDFNHHLTHFIILKIY